MQITEVSGTDLFVGSNADPHQIVRVGVAGGVPIDPDRLRVRVEGAGVRTAAPATITRPGADSIVAEVPVAVDERYTEGSWVDVLATAESAGTSVQQPRRLQVARPGWTMVLVPHFHYDPVWWNTQAAYTTRWDELDWPGSPRLAAQRTSFVLVAAHLDKAIADPDYSFVLAEVDYLKPFFDAHPERRQQLRALLRAGRVELVGGAYNEPNTNLTALETTIRNAVYGLAFQRDVLGGDPRTAWQLDVFGHDPAYPAVMAEAGLTSAAWARGPFHQWGPQLTVGDNTRMQFPSEFEWIAPDGTGLLTSYMASHYSAGWQLDAPATLAEAEQLAYELFGQLKAVAATRTVLLPVGTDHVLPARWSTEIQRDWNARYRWPRFVVGLPKDFFAAVRDDAHRRRIAFRPQSRDMNPVYTGKDVSYIDTKQAHRAAENAVLDGEKLATLAACLGAPYPTAALDKAWRQLLFAAHHDAITGTEGDQVYVDLLGGWREAYEIGVATRTAAVDHLAGQVDRRGPGHPLLVVNPLSWPCDGLVSIGVAAAFGDHPTVVDDTGRPVPALRVDGADESGGTGRAMLTFHARQVPAGGYRCWHVVDDRDSRNDDERWRPIPGTQIRNERFTVTSDPRRGGTLTSIVDTLHGRELLSAGQGGNELLIDEEYPEHPSLREGPWHLLPTGARWRSSSLDAQVRAERCPLGERLLIRWTHGKLSCTQQVLLWRHTDRIDVRTTLNRSPGDDRLVRVRFPLDVPGGLPVSETGHAVIGRGFGLPDVDAASAPWTLDNPAYNWFGLGHTAKLLLRDGGIEQGRRALGVAEVVTADSLPVELTRALVVALAQQGVTATSTRPDGPRYGNLQVDSNLPDFRISVGGPDDNTFTAAVLAAHPAARAHLADRLSKADRVVCWVPAARPLREVWGPNADLTGVHDLPVLLVVGRDERALRQAVDEIVADLADAAIEVDQPIRDPDANLDDYSVALLNRGTPGFAVDPTGALHLSLLRSCTGWPAGVWIDPPHRRLPHGDTFQSGRWPHTFDYALTAAPGDWRQAGFVRHGQEYNHPLIGKLVPAGTGLLPGTASLLEIRPAHVVLTALKPAGHPFADGSGHTLDPSDGVIVRCYEAHGRPSTARVTCRFPLAAAQRSTIAETPGSTLEVARGPDGSTVEVQLTAAATATLALTPALGAIRSTVAVGPPAAESGQPVYTRYWRHNLGSAPIGNQVVSVHLTPDRLAAPDGSAEFAVTLVSDATDGPRSGRLELVVPVGLTLSPSTLDYKLDPGEHERVPVELSGAETLAPGRYFIAARIGDELGQTYEDVSTLDIGAAATAPPEPELDAVIDATRLRIRRGEASQISVRLRNHCASELRGEARLLSPYGSWTCLPDWATGFALPANGQRTLSFPVRPTADTQPGSWWAIVKLSYFGRLYYTETVELVVTEGA